MYWLSHYTSRAGLEGIASSGALWATHMLDVEDTSEYLFGWHAIQKAAIEYMMPFVPEKIRNPDFNLDETAKGATAQFREWVKATNEYGLLYMTSFARARTDHEEERGIRTLWSLYGDHKGYCLQFDRTDVRSLAQRDASRSSYAWLDLQEVQYDIDKDASDFRELGFQVGEQFLMLLARATKRWDIKLKVAQHWPPSVLNARIMQYCGTHKDPAFSDEREVRILAYPAEQAVPVFLSGIATPKKVRQAPSGKRYISIGENWTPGISPRRIIIGTKADPNIEHIVAKFQRRPEMAHANLPIA